MRTLKSNILAMDEYSVEQDIDRIKLNQNESSEDLPSSMKQKILERMEAVNWSRYPSGGAGKLVDAIADYTGFPSSGIIVGNGSNEMIQTLVYSTCDSGQSIVVAQPGFSVYKRVAEVMNVGVIEVPLADDFSFEVESFIEAGQNAQAMFLAAPNNPTGTTLNDRQIELIAESVPCMVAVDEAYYEFSGVTVQPLIRKHDNIVILRTFSKALRIAGLRLGYMLGPESLIWEFKKVKLPFSVGLLQQIAGEILLEKRALFSESARRIVTEKDRVFDELRKMEGIQAVPSHANFILFETQMFRARDVFNALLARGVLIRCFDSQRLENMLRVTIGTPEENEVFLHSLRDVIGRRRNEGDTL
jgi:histidinol-phosphate aminotransferase